MHFLQPKSLKPKHLQRSYSVCWFPLLEEGGQMSGLTGSYGNGPVRQFLFQLTLNGGQIAGDNQLVVFYLVADTGFLDKHCEQVCTKLSSCPGRKNRQTFRILDKQPTRNLRALNLTGNNKVGKREVTGNENR